MLTWAETSAAPAPRASSRHAPSGQRRAAFWQTLRRGGLLLRQSSLSRLQRAAAPSRRSPRWRDRSHRAKPVSQAPPRGATPDCPPSPCCSSGCRGAVRDPAARDQLELNDALGAEREGDCAVEPLRRRGHKDPDAAAERGLDLRPVHDLRKMRRTDLLLSLRYAHQVYGELPACAANGVECGEERRLRALLVHGAPPHNHFSEPRLFDERGLPGRRGPL